MKKIWIIFVLLISRFCFADAGDPNLLDMTLLATPSGVDRIYIVDDPNGTPVDRAITLAQLFTIMDASSELRAIMDDETGTGVLVFGTSPTFTTNITTPQVTFTDADASPDAVGELLYDNTVTGLLDGAFAWYDDDAVRYLVDLATLPVDDDYVVAYDAVAEGFYMKADADSGGATAYDDIGDPDAASSITFADGETVTWATSEDSAGSFFLIQNSDADLAANTYLLDLDYSVDDNQANADYVRCQDAGGVVFSIQQDGDTASTGTIEGATLTEGGDAVYSSGETPGGELGGTWASPTIDDSLSVSSWTLVSPTFTTAITATDLIDSVHYVANSIDNEHINWADIDNLGDEGAVTLAATVTTNANLTGEVTSVGNAATIADSVAVTSWNLTTPTFTTTALLAGILQDNDDMVFECDADSDGSNKFSFTDGAAAEKFSISETGVVAASGTITAVGSFIIGSADMAEADLEKLDGITDGTAAANKALVLDASLNIATINSLTATTLVGALTGNADTATVGTTVTITDNEATAENNPIVFVAGADPDGGSLGLETDGTTYYTPSTGTITATGFAGAVTTTTLIKSEPKHMVFNIINPLATQTEDNEICLWPAVPAALTVTKIQVTLDAAANEVAGDLKWADAFIGLAGATVINVFDTSSGVLVDATITAGTVASGKCLYIAFDSAPNTAIKQMCVDITYDYD